MEKTLFFASIETVKFNINKRRYAEPATHAPTISILSAPNEIIVPLSVAFVKKFMK